jgi:hypothetical protein
MNDENGNAWRGGLRSSSLSDSRRRRRGWPRSTAKIKANKRKQDCFHLLSFIFANRDFSMGYAGFK